MSVGTSANKGSPASQSDSLSSWRKATATAKGPEYDTEEEEDEDLVEFEFNDETLLKGVVSGKIFRTTTEAGDVQVGVCGQGIFKDIKV